MSDPFDTPTGRWGLIFHGGGSSIPKHTRQEWAQIAEAIGFADAGSTGGVRGDDAWCQEAVDTYQRLRDADAYGQLRQDPSRWYLNENLVRTWLAAPVIPPDAERPTMLDALGWATRFEPGRSPHPAYLTLLVDEAQSVGVIGNPLHRATLLRAVDRGHLRDDAMNVALYPPDAPGLVSEPVRIDGDLLGAERSAVDRIVGVLLTVAVIATNLMRSHESRRGPGRDPSAATRVRQPDGTGVRARPFRVIDGGNSPANPGTPPTPPPTTPRRSRG